MTGRFLETPKFPAGLLSTARRYLALADPSGLRHDRMFVGSEPDVYPEPVVSCLMAGNTAGSGARSRSPRVRREPRP
jgi:hypothetical protein